MREFSVLLRRDPALEGESPWVAHCLNWDLISQGDSPKHAIMMIFEAIVMTIVADEAESFDPDARPSAPEKSWDEFRKIQNEGFRVAANDVNAVADQANVAAFAAVVYLDRLPDHEHKSSHRNRSLSDAPAPFMIAALKNGDCLTTL